MCNMVVDSRQTGDTRRLDGLLGDGERGFPEQDPAITQLRFKVIGQQVH